MADQTLPAACNSVRTESGSDMLEIADLRSNYVEHKMRSCYCRTGQIDP